MDAVLSPPQNGVRHGAQDGTGADTRLQGRTLLLARGRFERIGENRNVVVDALESLGPLARRLAEADVGAALPAAHHFGHR